jgi:hypothetical protein
MSIYAYWRAHNEEYIEKAGERYMYHAHRLGFKEFIECNDETVMLHVRNGMTAWLGRDDFKSGYREVTETDYESACRHLDSMLFVGIQECFSESVYALARLLLIPTVGDLPNLNSSRCPADCAAPAQESPVDFPLAAVSWAERCNSFDMRLYCYATELHARHAALWKQLPAPDRGRLVGSLRIKRPSLFRNAPVRFGDGETGNGLLAGGWSSPEEGYVWSDGDSSELVFRLHEPVPAGTPLTLQIMPFLVQNHPYLQVLFDINGQPLQTTLFIYNGCSATLLDPGPALLLAVDGHGAVTLNLPLPELASGLTVLRLRYGMAAAPANLGCSLDHRMLGVALFGLAIG